MSLISNFQSKVKNETKITSGKWVNRPTPLPSGMSWASDPPSPKEFPIPSVVGMDISQNYTENGIKQGLSQAETEKYFD